MARQARLVVSSRLSEQSGCARATLVARSVEAGTTTVQIVEKYNIAERKWYTAPPISSNCSASAACIVQDVADPASWI
ncbi:hypothetical protein MTO96_028469 [Rhipicephalus appendiculatus]